MRKTPSLFCKLCGKGYVSFTAFCDHEAQCQTKLAASVCLFVCWARNITAASWVVEAADKGTL